MRDPARIDRILGLLREKWRQQPDLRLGQLVGDALLTGDYGGDPYYGEDDVVEKGFRLWLGHPTTTETLE